MPRKRYTAEQIITTLRQAEVEIARGQAVAEVCRKLGTSEQTYYRWRKEYGGLRVNHLKRLKALELENRRLRTVVADQALALVDILGERSMLHAHRLTRAVGERAPEPFGGHNWHDDAASWEVSIPSNGSLRPGGVAAGREILYKVGPAGRGPYDSAR